MIKNYLEIRLISPVISYSSKFYADIIWKEATSVLLSMGKCSDIFMKIEKEWALKEP